MVALGSYRHGLRAQHSLPDNAEFVTDLLAVELSESMEDIINAFVPDGRRIGEEKLSIEEQLINYKMTILDDPMGWLRFVTKVFNDVESRLAEVPLDVREAKKMGPDAVRSFAIANAVAYRAGMEAKLQKALTQASLLPTPVEPSLPEEPVP